MPGLTSKIKLANLFQFDYNILPRLYSKSGNTPKYDVLFLLSSGGKLNYLASKTWLEKKLSSDSLETVLLNEVEFVLCLDGIGKDGLHLHVSKQPKEGTVVTE